MILFHWGNLVECLFLLSLDFETIHEANLSAFDDPKEYEDAPHMTSFKESMHYWKSPPPPNLIRPYMMFITFLLVKLFKAAYNCPHDYKT
jgi:hypothetical protein